MRRIASGLSLSAAMLVLGVLLVLSFSIQERAKATTPRKDELLRAVDRLAADREALEDRLASLRHELSTEQGLLRTVEGRSKTRLKEDARLREAAGLSALRGPGVEVTLSDAGDAGSDLPSDDLVVHDYDIAAFMNVLLSAGAEAIAVNGERVVWRSALRSAGTTVMLDARPLSAPYTISAIGEPGRLLGALQGDSYTSRLLSLSGATEVSARAEKREELQLAGYTGAMGVSLAQTDERPRKRVKQP